MYMDKTEIKPSKIFMIGIPSIMERQHHNAETTPGTIISLSMIRIFNP